MKTYHSGNLVNETLLEQLCNEGGEHTYSYICKYEKQRFVPFYVVKNKYGKNTIVFRRNGRKYEQEHFWYNQLSSKVLVEYEK
jgi:hypothetical protein